ncbi:hypothetical protein FH609_026005 [Streptomyces sp. 3MP-14]|uniref:Glycosyl hydrolase family 12 n=1 Tax=Streptomyces mimosae TaxID=2586635 RepID=A0A5N5ZYR1_9ACTN|nr:MULTISPECIES: hypothetical protein [Streptomyces]KAB8161624.1 hypothetical protein FH607_024945 [Streptomyces mimosae]KAB8173439.1 hypothetical protein FH609_026005 [Streptomyces sp. 3MP-14]
MKHPKIRNRRGLGTLVLAPAVALTCVVGLGAGTAHAAVFESCDQWGNWTDPDGYIVYNNIWGSGAGSQCIEADSGSRWSVTADHPNTGGIKSYPNAKWIVGESIADISTLTSTFDVSVPNSGAYNTAYDVWDENYDHEIMLWMNWTGPVGPLGTPVGEATVGGHTWDVYNGSNGSNNVYSFLRQGNASSGQVDILPILDWITEQGWMDQNEVIGDVQFGYEITSSAGGLTFQTNEFSVNHG